MYNFVTAIPIISKYFDAVYGEKLRQMKSHRFFCHLAQEIQNFGTPYDFSSAFFEMINRIIKVNIHPYDTNSLPEHALENMLSRKDWISQVSNIPNSSDNFKNLLKRICPAFNIRQVIYSRKDKNTHSDNSYIHFIIEEKHYFGQILNVIDETFNVQTINGTSLLFEVNDSEKIPEDLYSVLTSFEKQPLFGIIVKEMGCNINIRKSNIVSHCCKFTDNSYEYIISLNFRCAGK